MDEPAPRRSVHDDPAVLGVRVRLFLFSWSRVSTSSWKSWRAQFPSVFVSFSHAVVFRCGFQTNFSLKASAPTAPAAQFGQYGAPAPSYPPTASQTQIQNPPVQPPQQQQLPPAQPQSTRGPAQKETNTGSAPTATARAQGPPQARRNNSVHTAAASLETVERALGDLRVANGAGGGVHHRQGYGHGRRGHGHGAHGHGANDIKAGEIKVPATDFDFQGSNALFDKAALAPRKVKDDEGSGDDVTKVDQGEDAVSREKKAEREKEKEQEPAAYNPQKSFFDSLSSSTHATGSRGGGDVGGGSGRGAGGGRRGGAGGKNRREEERERNVATFGEPGGVGLLGPGELSCELDELSTE